MTTSSIHIFETSEELHSYAADRILELATAAIGRNGRCLLALSGGGTPQPLYALLAQEPYRSRINWDKLFILFADERCVPPDAEGSNYKMVADTLLKQVPIPTGNVLRVHGELSPQAAALQYAGQLKTLASLDDPWPSLDIALLGMGSDGHTASLFPGPISALERSQPVIPAAADYEGRPAERVSLTPLILNTAAEAIFLVTGANKAETVNNVLHGPAKPETYPAQRIQPATGQTRWLLDSAAATQLQPKG